MAEINWNAFKAKFNGKLNNTFESLSYQLFCIEHDNNIGVFRFKNQTGIETEPIQTDEGWIGFQAKYYDTKIADNKDDIVDSIKKAKRENKNLFKVLLYLNQEFSESTTKEKKDPAYKTEIEEEAQKINLIIEWRVPSHFERQLMLPQNLYLTEYFFSLDKNIIDFIDGLKLHTENLLYSIQTDITFNGQIKINRKETVEHLKQTQGQSKPIILSGEGGCGKTAIIKDFYDEQKGLTPFYIFKALEFNIQEIKSLFKNYGDYSLQDFITAHEKESSKIVVIDSAERISDLENQEPFKEFLSELLKNSWTIIFTTRLSYLDDLRFQFLSIYRLPFEHVTINILSEKELEEISKKYAFDLPENARMRNIIRNPFYLDEYLRSYASYTNSVFYAQFKETIWARKIQNSNFKKDNAHISRENCFLNLVKLRSEHGVFYISPTGCTDTILSMLLKDDIIGYDRDSGGYFIAHDIYEEWGLNMLIERAYNKTINYNTFLNEIGTSLTVRRAFRQWLSDKLIDNIDEIKPFVEYAFENSDIEPFWKDEILTSILLSEYSEEFFNQFKEKTIENDFSILKKILFLLRITCKEADNSLSKFVTNTKEGISLSYFFTKPKGKGWNSIIHLIYENQNAFSPSFLPHLIPVLSDWCSNNKRGRTTREAGLLALKFYNDIQTDDDYRYNSEITTLLIKIIIQSANEIKEELTILFDEVLAKPLERRELYYDLCQAVISSDIENFPIILALPQYVLKLAGLFWIDTERKAGHYSGTDVEKYYGINRYGDHSYFPASALQTPIYSLLQFSFSQTIDFIIDFVNRTVENYAKSGFDEGVKEVELIIDNNAHKQYLSDSLWNMYRGVGSPVSPYLLQSIHMALEKHLLEIAEKEEPEIIESWLLYLIKSSKSASITSIVTSVVLAFPNKFFNVAKVLFRCSELFFHDNSRAKIGESQAQNIYSIGRGMNFRNKRYESERLKTCDDKHRALSLESLIVQYQFFRNEQVSEEEAKNRQTEIWAIIDKFYTELPEKGKETDDDKTKQLLLVRIDRRKMNPKVERQEDKLIIDFNPEIDEELKNHSEEAIKQSIEMIKYSALKLWASYKFDNSKTKGDYERYENNPQLVLKETKEIIEELNNGEQEYFHLFNHSTPAFTCSALIREYSSQLSDDDKKYCAQIIAEYATLSFAPDYRYQISDGVEVTINAIPALVELFPNEKDELLSILLFTLFNPTPIGYYKRVCDYVIEAVNNNLWRISFDDAQKVLGGFLKFKPIFNSIVQEIKNESISSFGWPRYTHSDVINRLIERHGNEIETFFSNFSNAEDFDLNQYNLNDLEIAFLLVPSDTSNNSLMDFVYDVLSIFAKKLLEDTRDKEIEVADLRNRIFNKFSHFILFRDERDINKYLQPFVDNFTVGEPIASLFQDIVLAEDRVAQYNKFWIIWEAFYEKIKTATSSRNYRLSEVVHNYLLAGPIWREGAKSWHTLKDREKNFYKKVVKDIGHLPFVLDSIAKLLNEIGSDFLNDGMFWISEMVEKNHKSTLEINTVYYIENIARRYAFVNRSKIRQDSKIKNKVLVVLNFLIERGSVNGYLLREDIL